MNSAVAFLILSFVAANLPFLTERRFYTRGQDHAYAWRLLELVLLYFILGGIAYFAERNMGSIQTQRWEFYAVTACLFLVFAYPGYVYRYLWRRRTKEPI